MEKTKKAVALEKLSKQLSEVFVDEVRAADVKALKEKIVQLSKEIEDIEEAKKSDTRLNTLKEEIKDLAGAYRDAKKEKAARLKYVILTLEERGDL